MTNKCLPYKTRVPNGFSICEPGEEKVEWSTVRIPPWVGPWILSFDWEINTSRKDYSQYSFCYSETGRMPSPILWSQGGGGDWREDLIGGSSILVEYCLQGGWPGTYPKVLIWDRLFSITVLLVFYLSIFIFIYLYIAAHLSEFSCSFFVVAFF